MLEYKKIKVGSLFNIHPTKSYAGLTNDELYKNIGNVPILSNSTESNGIGGYVALAPTEKGGIITFSDTTNGAATIFYQPNDFIGYSHVQGMYPVLPEKWNENSLLYFVVALKKAVGVWYDWATKFTREICMNIEVDLPIKTNGDVDYEEMDKTIEKYKSIVTEKKERFLFVNGYRQPLSVDEKKAITQVPNYSTFKIRELFVLKSNPQLNKDAFVSNNKSEYPYFTRTVFNNGIEGYVDYLDDNHKTQGNSISVGMLGMQFFYQPHDYYAGQFTKAVFPLFDRFNKNIGLYFASIFNKHSNRLKGVLVRDFENLFYETGIDVPVKSDGGIDFDYIENYIAAYSKTIVAKYL